MAGRGAGAAASGRSHAGRKGGGGPPCPTPTPRPTLDGDVHVLQVLLVDVAALPQHAPVVVMVAAVQECEVWGSGAGGGGRKGGGGGSLAVGATLSPEKRRDCSQRRRWLGTREHTPLPLHSHTPPPSFTHPSPFIHTPLPPQHTCFADCHVLLCRVLVQLLVPLLQEGLVQALGGRGVGGAWGVGVGRGGSRGGGGREAQG
jgi:hypothetical protein